MINAQTDPTTWSYAQRAAFAPFKNRTDSLICVMNRTADIGRLREELTFMGVTKEQVEVLHGTNGLNRLRTFQPASSLLSGLRRWLSTLTLGPGAQPADRYARVLHDGDLLIAVCNVDRGLAGEIVDILAAHGAKGIHHYGRFTIAFLSSPQRTSRDVAGDAVTSGELTDDQGDHRGSHRDIRERE